MGGWLGGGGGGGGGGGRESFITCSRVGKSLGLECDTECQQCIVRLVDFDCS